MKSTTFTLMTTTFFWSWSSSSPICSVSQELALHNSYLECQVRAQTTLRDGRVEVCDYFHTSVELCTNAVALCRNETQIRLLKDHALRVSYRALAVEEQFDVTNLSCPIFDEYNFDPSTNRPLADSSCDDVQFKEAYQLFFACKTSSESSMRDAVARLGPGNRDTDELDHIVCHHFKHTLNVCFEEIRRCASNEQSWQSTRHAFISSVRKTNELEDLGLKLEKCDLEGDNGHHQNDDDDDDVINQTMAIE